MTKTRRWGEFEMSRAFIDCMCGHIEALQSGELDWPGEWKAFAEGMGRVLILSTHFDPSREVFCYQGVSPDFDEVEEGDAIPSYNCHFETVRQCCCSGGKFVTHKMFGEKYGPCCSICGEPESNAKVVSRFKGWKRT